METKPSVSLNNAKENFTKVGACEVAFVDKVRPPIPSEVPSGI